MTGEHSSVIYGTHYPNRLFVGCLPLDTDAEALGEFFSCFGNVVEAKVVLDSEGRSKRFGFVTFSSSDNVEKLIKSRAIVFKGKMINVGPAVKKNLENETCCYKGQTNKYTKSSAMGPQHTPKTIIRRSPTDTQSHPRRYNSHHDDTTFCTLWGISGRKANSVWTPTQTTSTPPFCNTFTQSSSSQNISWCSELNNSMGSLSLSNSSNENWRLDNRLNNSVRQQQFTTPWFLNNTDTQK